MNFTVHSELTFEFDKVEISSSTSEIEFVFNLDHRISRAVLREFYKTIDFRQKVTDLLVAYSRDNWPEIMAAAHIHSYFAGYKNTIWVYTIRGGKRAGVSIRLNQPPSTRWTPQDIENFNWLC